MLKKVTLLVMAVMFWMASAANAQQLPSGTTLKSSNAARAVFGDLNNDGEVNMADVNVLIDVILGGDYTPTDPDVPNMTIAEFKAKHWQDNVHYIDTVTEDEVIHGWVVSSDESGNIYKALYIMDESGAGLTISLNKTNLYRDYPIGQEIVLHMKGYCVGKYAGQQQIGAPYYYAAQNVWEATFLSLEQWEQMAVVKGDPDPERVEPLEVTIADLANHTDSETQLRYQGALVHLSGVKFAEADGETTFSNPGATTNRVITDADDNSMIVRTSNYANFCNDVLPSGEVDITGVLTYYASRNGVPGTWQIYLRDRDDVVGGEILPPAPADTVTSLDEGFDVALPTDWRNMKVSGDRKWYQAIYAGNGYAVVTGFNGLEPPFEAWLITPPLDIEHAENPILTFRTQVKAYNSTTTVFEVYLLNNIDPTQATIIERLDPVLATAVPTGYSDWAESGDVDLSRWADGVYCIGFCYKSPMANNYATWCLDDVKFGK